MSFALPLDTPGLASYRLLAQILASSLAGSESDPSARAEEAGRAWGAHLVRNDTEEPVRVLIGSTKGNPALAVYPDSDKIGIWTGNDEADPPRLFRIGTELDYWDGES